MLDKSCLDRMSRIASRAPLSAGGSDGSVWIQSGSVAYDSNHRACGRRKAVSTLGGRRWTDHLESILESHLEAGESRAETEQDQSGRALAAEQFGGGKNAHD